MTGKEIIGAAIKLQAVPRCPATLMSAGAWALNSAGISLEKALSSDPEKIAAVLYEAYNRVGSDIFWAVSGFNNILIGAIGGKIKFRSKGTPDVIEPLVKHISDIDGSDGTSGIGINAFKDTPNMRFLYETTRFLVQRTGGTNFVALTRWGPFTLAGLLYGAENLMRSIYRDPASVHRLLEWTTALYLADAQNYIDSGVDFALVAEPTASGDMISREHFAEFALPAFTRVFTALKQKGIATCLHICGNIENRLDLLNGIGADLISVDYKVSLKKCREIFGGKTAFAGNMNPVGIIQRESPEGVAKACEQCITEAGEDTGYILMPGCDIPPSTPVENIKAMVNTGKNTRRIV
ncbi:MAG: uroporphyrinogen decarboxylase family protein [Treponema sp.]|jgi:uroporphyrinogen decarboxylase|nr:uroporphyrinogen decarboxylase family protein [Treponema sp.]